MAATNRCRTTVRDRAALRIRRAKVGRDRRLSGPCSVVVAVVTAVISQGLTEHHLLEERAIVDVRQQRGHPTDTDRRQTAAAGWECRSGSQCRHWPLGTCPQFNGYCLSCVSYWLAARTIWRMLFAHEVRRAFSIADMIAGIVRPIRMPMIVITTSNSTSVNPAVAVAAPIRRWRLENPDRFQFHRVRTFDPPSTFVSVKRAASCLFYAPLALTGQHTANYRKRKALSKRNFLAHGPRRQSNPPRQSGKPSPKISCQIDFPGPSNLFLGKHLPASAIIGRNSRSAIAAPASTLLRQIGPRPRLVAGWQYHPKEGFGIFPG